MSSDETADTLPPPSDGPIATEPGDPVGSLFDLLDMVVETAEDLKKPRTDGRPKEIWVRWRNVEGGVEITACTLMQLEAPKGEGEHEGRFR